MSHRKANFNNYAGRSNKPIQIGEGSGKNTPPSWLMLILSFIVGLLTTILEKAKNKKNRLNP